MAIGEPSNQPMLRERFHRCNGFARRLLNVMLDVPNFQSHLGPIRVSLRFDYFVVLFKKRRKKRKKKNKLGLPSFKLSDFLAVVI